MADQHSRTIQIARGLTLIVDESDYGYVMETGPWTPQPGKAGTFYAMRTKWQGEKRKVYLHRILIGVTPDRRVDHINGNGLDNRRSNLRVCSNAENMRNMRRGRGRSIYKGVAWFTRDECWRAYIVMDAKQIHLGYFATEVEAAEAYDESARRLFGAFAKLNFTEPS